MTVEAPDLNYVAIRDIDFNGVRAYGTGDPVHTAAVEGPDAWLTLGVDVQAREGAKLDRPAKSATAAAWAAYAISQGMDPDEAEGTSRKDLISQYGDEEDRAPAKSSSSRKPTKAAEAEPTPDEAVNTGVDAITPDKSGADAG